MIEPAITSLAPWYGAKRKMATRIVAELGEHRAYWEPFCGSMAVLLSKPKATQETVNDLHGDLTNLAWVLQDPVRGPKLFRRLRRVLASETELAGRFKRARVVVSYYDHPRLADLYPADRWTKIDCSTGKNTSNANGGASVAPEVLLVNGESFTKGDS